MASDHRGRPLHAGKRTDDENYGSGMGDPTNPYGDPLLKKASQNPVPNSSPNSQVPNSSPSKSTSGTKKTKNSVPNTKVAMLSTRVSKVPPMVTGEGIKRTAKIAGNRAADVALGAGVGGALGLTPGIKYSNYDAQGMPTEANYVVHPMGAAIGAAIGGAAIGGLGRYLDKRDKK